MVGRIERYETLGMFGRPENLGRILDADDLVARCVENEQGLLQGGDGSVHALATGIIHKLLLYVERPPGKIDLGHAVSLDVF